MAHILVIDDEKELLIVLKEALEKVGHTVVFAPDGESGLKEFQRARFDLVLCDLFMPIRDGFDTLKQIRGMSPNLPIIIMSGGARSGSPVTHPRVDYLQMASEFGASGTLQKPFPLAALTDMIARVLSPAGDKL
jgi:CheY-like chemotaxis protein